MKKKKIIIASIAVIAILIILGKSKAKANTTSSSMSSSEDFSTPDEKTTYEAILKLIPMRDLDWVLPLVRERGGDRAIALADVVQAAAPNPSGRYRYDYGNTGTVINVLWDEPTMAKIYEISQAYKRRNGYL